MEKKSEYITTEHFLPFDPIILVQDVVKRWLLILVVALAVGVGSYIYVDSSYRPVYKTTTTFVVTSRSSSSSVYSNLTSTSNLATVFTDLLGSSLLRKTILQETGLNTYEGMINAAAIPETNLITATVTASDPRTAFLVAQAIIEHHESVTYQVVPGLTLEVLQQPSVPSWPSNSANAMYQMKRMCALGAIAAVIVIVMISYSRKTIRSGTEAKKLLHCSYLGEIPHEEKYKTLFARIRRRKTSILITNPATSFRFIETIRKLRRRVEQHMHSDKVLMVTSLLENEGKSTVAVNLALDLAQKHTKVLLIDCDLRKPACHTILQQNNIPHGLRDVLTDKAALNDALIRSKKSNLFMLLETRGTKNSGDLISSERMQALLKWARWEFDFVVLDLPPMAEVSDAESMTEFADASMLVVRQNTAASPAINKAIASLERGNAKLLGCVLNNVYSTFLTASQSYGYGRYGYGRYGHYGHYGHYSHYGTSAKNTDQ